MARLQITPPAGLTGLTDPRDGDEIFTYTAENADGVKRHRLLTVTTGALFHGGHDDPHRAGRKVPVENPCRSVTWSRRATNGLQPLRWIGRRRVTARKGGLPPRS